MIDPSSDKKVPDLETASKLQTNLQAVANIQIPPETDTAAEPSPKSEPKYLDRILKTYDRTFIGILALLYINGGFKVLFLTVAQDMFKT